MSNPNPSEAVEIHLQAYKSEVTQETLQSTEYRLGHFVRWCDEVAGIDHMQDLTPEDMHDYRVWRREDGGLARASEKTQMDSLRVFIRRCERMGMVQDDLHDAVVSPSLKQEDRTREDIVDYEQAKQILNYLDRYHYASRNHVMFLLAWRSAMRTSALRALDVDDYDSDDRYIEVQNRPDRGTRLKNGDNGERHVALTDETCAIIDDYFAVNRVETTDEYGRDPLLSTKQGRIAKTTIRGAIYRLTRPCWFGDVCPHDRELSECRAHEFSDYVFECPSSTAPHSVRRGSITHMLRSDVPERVVSDRADVSEEVLDEHYDKRTGREKMEDRRDFLGNM